MRSTTCWSIAMWLARQRSRMNTAKSAAGITPSGKDLPHEVLPAAQEDVCNIGLRLKNGAQERRQMLVDFDDLLKLVQNKHDTAVALTCDALRQFEQLFQQVFSVVSLLRDGQLDAPRAVRIDGQLR